MIDGLVLSRKPGESILIGDDIEITLVSIGPGNRVRLRVVAPRATKINRKEKAAKEDGHESSETET